MFVYQPYGSGTAAPQFTYTGQRIDAETDGLYYYRARHYSTALGRFLQSDPAGYSAGTNLYAYVFNDPLNLIDALGLAADSPEAKSIFRLMGEGVYGMLVSGPANLPADVAENPGRYATATAAAAAIVALPVIFAPPAATVAPALPEALTIGNNAQRGIDVYLGVRNGEAVYCGVTCNIAQRAMQHGDRFDALRQVTTSSVTRGQARAIEQALMQRNPGFENIRNSISPTQPWYREAVNWGERYLQSIGR